MIYSCLEHTFSPQLPTSRCLVDSRYSHATNTSTSTSQDCLWKLVKQVSPEFQLSFKNKVQDLQGGTSPLIILTVPSEMQGQNGSKLFRIRHGERSALCTGWHNSRALYQNIPAHNHNFSQHGKKKCLSAVTTHNLDFKDRKLKLRVTCLSHIANKW